MPELPEVQTITTDLKKHLVGTTIKTIRIKENYKTLPKNEDFLKNATGQKIINVTRIAKNIKIDLENNHSIVIHLAMTGRVLLRTEEFKKDSWEKVVFTLNKGEKSFHMRFCDMRMFGKVVLADRDALKTLAEKYGPEPISSDITPEIFLKQLLTKKTTIKNALLDQNIISGLGNIYATDALFISKIHPETPTNKFTIEMAKRLLEASKVILEEGISHRGSTLEDKMYVDVFGKPGEHQKYFRIYGKSMCPECKNKVEFKKINGRGTYFCPNCQTMDSQNKLL